MVPSASVEPTIHVRKRLAPALWEWCVSRDICYGEVGLFEVWQSETYGYSKPNPERAGQFTGTGAQMCLDLGLDVSNSAELYSHVLENRDVLIDMVDWLVHEALSGWPPAERAERLQENRSLAGSIESLKRSLEIGGSSWRVDIPAARLTQGASDGEREMYAIAVKLDDPISGHLRKGWAAAWGVKPDGDVAYDKAVKALEATFRPTVTPRDPVSTLSQIASVLSDKPPKWQARFVGKRDGANDGRPAEAGVDLASRIMRTIFQGHHRHGDSDSYVENTVDEGRDAITLAVALVALQRRGFLGMNSEQNA